MTILSHNELLAISGLGWSYSGPHNVIEGVRSFDDVNASSIDVRLGNLFLEENAYTGRTTTLSLSRRDAMGVRAHKGQYTLAPGEFVLAHTAEKFNLPLDISAEFRLKSSAARMGLSHALAVWCDPGWHDSTLTLELHNISRYHSILLQEGDKIGQMIFHRHAPVPPSASYAERGAYNQDAAARGAKPPKE